MCSVLRVLSSCLCFLCLDGSSKKNKKQQAVGNEGRGATTHNKLVSSEQEYKVPLKTNVQKGGLGCVADVGGTKWTV